MRIVIDTNVVVSAIFFGGRPRELLEKLFQHDFNAFISKKSWRNTRTPLLICVSAILPIRFLFRLLKLRRHAI